MTPSSPSSSQATTRAKGPGCAPPFSDSSSTGVKARMPSTSAGTCASLEPSVVIEPRMQAAADRVNAPT